MPLSSRSPYYVLLECSHPDDEASAVAAIEALLEEAFEASLITDAALARSIAQSRALWALRENISEAQGAEGKNIKHDVSVPISRIAHFVDAAGAALASAHPGVRPVVFGHLGDGNLHWNIRAPFGADPAWLKTEGEAARSRLHDLIAEFGGSISAEHGIGTLKRAELGRLGNPARLAAMRAIKAALDPADLMNPGKLIP